MIRNLLYNCCPFAGNEEWRLNVERLNRYADVFNGRRIVLLKTGEGLHQPEVAKQAFSFDAEFIEVGNDPVLGEVAGFIDALYLLQSRDPNEATFYAHTKGITRAAEPDKLISVRLWRNQMYEKCLGDVAAVEAALSQHSTAGCFKIHKGIFNESSSIDVPFHYSGTFFWLNHERLFSKPDWTEIHTTRHGVEGYPGLHFEPEEAFCFTNIPELTGGQLYGSWTKYSYMAEHEIVWSDSAKLVFLHNHKTAGRSVWETLATILPDMQRERAFLYPVAPRDGCLRRELEIAGLGDYYTFGFVRNPWDRLVSYYTMLEGRTERNTHALKPDICEYHRIYARQADSFETFLRRILGYTAPDGSSLGRSQLDTYFSDKNGQLAIDKIYAFENLHADFAEMLRDRGLPDVPLLHANASEHEHYSAYYNEETKNFVGRLFKRDIEAFGYTFDRQLPYRAHERAFVPEPIKLRLLQPAGTDARKKAGKKTRFLWG
jgi:hypothetical protein